MLGIADVDPEPTPGTTGFLAPEHGHRGVVGPQDGRLQHQRLLQLGQRLEYQSSVPHPVAQGAARDEHPVSREDVFESIKREMVGELARNHERHQAGAGDPARNGLGGHGGTGHAVATFGAGVLGQDVNFHLQPRRDEIEFARLVFANARFGAAAAGARFLGFGHVVHDADVGKMIEPGSPRSASCRRPLRRRLGGRGGAAGSGSAMISGISKRWPWPGSSVKRSRRWPKM